MALSDAGSHASDVARPSFPFRGWPWGIRVLVSCLFLSGRAFRVKVGFRCYRTESPCGSIIIIITIPSILFHLSPSIV